MSETVLFIICLILIAIGYIGIFVPVLPGVVLIFISTLIYGIFSGFERITVGTLVLFAGLTIITIIAEYAASAMGVKKFGASKYGIYGTLIGGILGLLVASLPGLIIGQLIGVIGGELFFGKELKASLRAGFGVFVGYLLGTAIKLIAATIITFIFIIKLI